MGSSPSAGSRRSRGLFFPFFPLPFLPAGGAEDMMGYESVGRGAQKLGEMFRILDVVMKIELTMR